MASTPERPTTEAEWSALVAAWQRSGLSQRAFAERMGVTGAALSYWKRKLDRPACAPDAVTPAAPTFVPVALAPAPAPAPPTTSFEVLSPTGWRVRVPADFEAHALGRLLATLRGLAC